MLRKPAAARMDVDVAYIGFDIANEFVVGYGLDYAERYRNLPFIGTLAPHVYKDDEPPDATRNAADAGIRRSRRRAAGEGTGSAIRSVDVCEGSLSPGGSFSVPARRPGCTVGYSRQCGRE